MLDVSTNDRPAETVRIPLSSGREWFASAFQAVLEPEGFSFVRVRTGIHALRDAGLIDPDIVVIDEGLEPVRSRLVTAKLRRLTGDQASPLRQAREAGGGIRIAALA